jgi:hypothetical protein
MAKVINKAGVSTSQRTVFSFYNSEGTASTGLTSIGWQNNTGDDCSIGFCNSNLLTRSTSNNNNRQFIRLVESFKDSIHRYPEFKKQLNPFSWEEKMKFSANLLLKFSPDKISLQITSGGSIYYTLLLGDLTLYVSHYLNAEEEDVDEYLVSVFSGEQGILHAAGNVNEVLQSLQKVFNRHNIRVPELA